MKNPDFNTSSGKKIYNSYLERVRKVSKVLSSEDRDDLLLEINSHIHEGMSRSSDQDEVAGLLSVLESLGEPEEFLQPMVADRKLKQATSTFNPLHVFQALALNVANGVKYIVFAFLYLLLFGFVAIVFTKLIAPENTGLFMENDEMVVFGYVQEQEGLTEILGWWFVPVALLCAALFYLLITLIMKLTSK